MRKCQFAVSLLFETIPNVARKDDNISALNIAVSATFTAEPLEDTLSYWLELLELPATISHAPYNQVFQQLLNSSSHLRKNRNGINILLIRYSDWFRNPTDFGEIARWGSYRTIAEQNTLDLVRALETAVQQGESRYIVCLCPSSFSIDHFADFNRQVETLEAVLRQELLGLSGVFPVCPTEFSHLYPVSDIYDTTGDKLGHIPYTDTYFAALGTMLARTVFALTSTPRKAIVLDCDQTLWDGVSGEDGPKEIRISKAYHTLQQVMVAQHDAGMLLCLCSKNSEQDVTSVFEQHPEMPLNLDHFVAIRINWRSKPKNIKSLAKELNISLDSFIFIDDNPIECAQVQSEHPEVHTLRLPENPCDIPQFINHVWAFDHLAITSEDARRTELYKHDIARRQLKQKSFTYESFLSGLGLKVDITELCPSEIQRVAQLTHRTNQFNFTTVRRSEAEIGAIIKSPEARCLVVRVRDRFGDYGLVGAIIFSIVPPAVELDSFLLSCRALGRGVEHRMLAELGGLATSLQIERLSARYIPTEKNSPALYFLNSLRCESMRQDHEELVFSIPTALAASLTYHPYQVAKENHETNAIDHSKRPDQVVAHSNPGHLSQIASEALSPAEIQQRVHQWKSSSPGNEIHQHQGGEPNTETEQKLIDIWGQILGLNHNDVSVDNSFFELGGNSLSATQVISRVQNTMATELSFQSFFDNPTISGIAAVIEKQGIGDGSFRTPPNAVENKSCKSIEIQTTPLQPSKICSSEKTSICVGDLKTSTRITSLGFMSYGREGLLNALGERLASYVENTRDYGRTAHFAVMDNCKTPEVSQKYKQMLADLNSRYNTQVFYASLNDQVHFSNQLIRSGGLPSDVVRFAMLGSENIGFTNGANRNCLLLHSIGEAVFSVDDDTFCRVAAPPQANDGLTFMSGRDPADYWFFPDRATAIQTASFVSDDFLSAHESLLGERVSSLMATQETRDRLHLTRADSRFRRRMESGVGKVRMTFNGVIGDCAWGPPFGFWGDPLGYLLLSGESHQRLVQSESDYHSACSSRDILRVVKHPAITDETFCQTTFAGFDNGDLLPPFFPVRRGMDKIFGITLRKCFEEVCFGHVPAAMLHAPFRNKRFWPGEITRSAAAYDIDKLIIDCIKSADLGSFLKPGEERLRALGRHLMELGSLRLNDFEDKILTQARQANGKYIALMEDTLLTYRESPDYWKNDVEKYIAILRVSMKRRDYWIPLDLLEGRSIEEVQGLAQRLVFKFGQLLDWWPSIVEVSRELKSRGQRVAQPV